MSHPPRSNREEDAVNDYIDRYSRRAYPVDNDDDYDDDWDENVMYGDDGSYANGYLSASINPAKVTVEPVHVVADAWYNDPTEYAAAQAAAKSAAAEATRANAFAVALAIATKRANDAVDPRNSFPSWHMIRNTPR